MRQIQRRRARESKENGDIVSEPKRSIRGYRLVRKKVCYDPNIPIEVHDYGEDTPYYFPVNVTVECWGKDR